MILFENTEYDNFFNPLCCKNKRIYYECILQLIEKSKSVPLLYENDAKDRNASYLHFGDIDAGGFWIHHNLCEITGVNFELFSMSADVLGNREFATCLHELSDNDRVRLQELKKINVYGDVVQYMLYNNVKLEQEIVSLTLMKSK